MKTNKINLVPLYSQQTRKNVSWLAGLGVSLVIVNLLMSTPFVNSSILLWCITLFLACINFSRLGEDQQRDQLARYITLKLTVSYFIGFLMATSFTEIFFNASMPSIKLFAALSGNIVFIVSHYVLYYFGTDAETELHDEGFKSLIQTQIPLLLAAIILTLITFTIILLWF